MSDPFSHNNFPGATARRPRPAKTKKPNTLKNNNSTDPDWFSNMEQTPPANAVSAVNVFSSKPKPPGVNSNVHAGRSRGIGIGGTNRGPKPPSRAKPPSKAKPPSRAKPKSSKGPGSTASGSNNNHNDNKNNNTFPRPPQTSRNQTQYNTETNFTTSDTGPTSSATYGSGMTNSQNYNSYSQQHQQQPYQQSYHQQQQQHQQQPSSISSFSSVPGMFNPTLPPMQMSGKMGEPVNQNTPLPIQQTQHSQQPKPSQTAISSVTQQHAFNNFSAPPAMLPGNFNPPAATTTNDSISGSMGNTSVRSATGNFDFSDEPPLLEELGVDMRRILSKTLAVVNPFKKIDTAVMTAQDSDLAGPVIFAITLGALLMFQGKLQFGYVFGLGVFGSLGLSNLFNLMAEEQQITFFRTMSILGYCMLPTLGLAALSIFYSLNGFSGLLLGGFSVLWCVYSSTTFFEVALNMPKRRWLIAYPVSMFYACFVMMTVF